MRLIYTALILLFSSYIIGQTVNITQPLDNDDFTVGEGITVIADVTIPLGIDNVKLFIDGATQSDINGNNKIEVDGSTVTTDTYTFLPSEWQGLQGLAEGSHTIRVQAKEEGSSNGAEQLINITISAGSITGSTTITGDSELIILKGQSELIGVPVTEIVGFTYNGGWSQIPVQIDEKVILPINTPYNGYLSPNSTTKCDGQTTESLADNWLIEFYADPNTHIGVDPDNTFDSNDEINFYFDRLNDQEGDGLLPAGTTELLAKLQITNSVDAVTRYVYLFRSTTLSPDNNESPQVTNNFTWKDDFSNPTYNLTMADYTANYRICNYEDNSNLENTTITAPNYTVHFSSRVRRDDIQIETGSGLGTDILTVSQGSNQNNRNIGTYETSVGAIATNKEGVNRVIRDVMGLSSGRYSVVSYSFTKSYEVLTLYNRVHGGNNAIVIGYEHNNVNVNGGTYSASNLVTPRTITGSFGEEIGRGGVPQTWDQLQTTQGNVTKIYDNVLENGAQSTFSSYYLDDVTAIIPPASTLFPSDNTGFYGAYGVQKRTSECTDFTYPNNATCAQYDATNVPIITDIVYTYYEPITTTQSDAQLRRLYYDTPAQVVSEDATGDGLANEIRISSPEDGATFESGISLDVTIQAQDDDGISTVELLVDGIVNNTISTGNDPTVYETTFFSPQDLSNLTAGTYVITARYTDALSNISTDVHTITVVDNSLPTQVVFGVSEGEQFDLGENINVTVSASDSDGTIQKVDLYLDGALFGTDISSPYQFFITGLSSGAHTIRVISTDDDDATADDLINFTVEPLQGSEVRVASSLIDLNAPLYTGKQGYTWTVGLDGNNLTTILQEPAQGNGIFSSTNRGMNPSAIEGFSLLEDFSIDMANSEYRLFDADNTLREFKFNDTELDISLTNATGNGFQFMGNTTSTTLNTLNGNTEGNLELGLITKLESNVIGGNNSFIELDASTTTGVRIETITNTSIGEVLTANNTNGEVEFKSVVDGMTFNFVDVDATTRRLDVSSAGVTVNSTTFTVSGTNTGGADDWGSQVAATGANITGDGTGASPLTVDETVLTIDYSQLTNTPIIDSDKLSSNILNVTGSNADFVLRDNNTVDMTTVSLEAGTNVTFVDNADALVINSEDDQTLSYVSATNTLTISGGNSVVFDAVDNFWSEVTDYLTPDQPNIQFDQPETRTEIRKEGIGNIPSNLLRFDAHNNGTNTQGSIVLTNGSAPAGVTKGNILIESGDGIDSPVGDIIIYSGLSNNKANSGSINFSTSDAVITNLAEVGGANANFTINSVNDAFFPSVITPLLDVTRLTNTTGQVTFSNSTVIVEDLIEETDPSRFVTIDPVTNQLEFTNYGAYWQKGTNLVDYLSPLNSTDRLYFNTTNATEEDVIISTKAIDAFTSASDDVLIDVTPNGNLGAGNIGGRFGIRFGESGFNKGLDIQAVHEANFGGNTQLGLGITTLEGDGVSTAKETFRLSGNGALRLHSYVGTFEDIATITTNDKIAVFDVNGNLKKTTDMSALISTDASNGIMLGSDGLLFGSAGGGGDTNTFPTSAAFNTGDGVITFSGTSPTFTVDIDGRFLQTEVDGSITNEIQDLSLSSNTLSLTSDATTVDLSPYLDDTDVTNVNFNTANGQLEVTENGNTLNDVIYSQDSDNDLSTGLDGGIKYDNILEYAMQYNYKEENTTNIVDNVASEIPLLLPHNTVSILGMTIRGVRWAVIGDASTTGTFEIINNNNTVIYSSNFNTDTASELGDSVNIDVLSGSRLFIRLTGITGGNIQNAIMTVHMERRE